MCPQSIFLLRLADCGGLLGNIRGRRLLLRSVLRPCGFHRREHNKKQRAEESDSLQVRHFDAAVLRSRIAYYRSWAADPLKKKHCIALLPYSQRLFLGRCHSFSAGVSSNLAQRAFKEYPCRAPCCFDLPLLLLWLPCSSRWASLNRRMVNPSPK